MKSSKSQIRSEALLNSLLREAEVQFSDCSPVTDILTWVQGLDLGGRKFTFEGHEFQREILTENAPRQVFKKAAQMGFTEACMLKTIHGLISGRYPQGALYLFPTQNDVTDFSKGRLAPLINDNPEVAQQVAETDAANVKRVRKAMLYLRGARSSGKVEGIKRTSSQLKSVPVDRIVFDEMDEMEPAMIDLAKERLGHSLIKEETYLSTPTIPDYGIDKLFNESDQRCWFIRCNHCEHETCLELEWPDCLLQFSNGRVIRACKNCKKEIYPKNGRWVPLYPDRSKDLVGFWISQLNSAFVSPAEILKAYGEASKRNMAEFYNSKLGMAYIPAENRLTVQDIFSNCGNDPMFPSFEGPCCMGVDVGAVLHVVVGYKQRGILRVCYLARVTSFNDLHDIARRFNVQCAVIDIEPETRAAREWQQAEDFQIFLCDYSPSLISGIRWDEGTMIIKAHRTETLDAVHDTITRNGIILPRRCEEVEEFARQLVNIAKVLEENQETGVRSFKYRKLGPDHYAHALNYCLLASTRVPEAYEDRRGRRQEKAITEYDVYAPPVDEQEAFSNY